MRLASRWLGIVGILMLLAGCGQVAMAPVKGTVTCGGKPVAQAGLIFAPEPSSEEDKLPGKPGTGFTDDAGNFVLSTYKPYDGAQVGKHKVTISLDDANPARCARQKHITLEVKAGANELDIELNK